MHGKEIGRQCRHEVSGRPARLLDGLMGGAILTDSDRVVCKHVNHREFHQGAQTEGFSHVIAKMKKPDPKGRTFTKLSPLSRAPMACSRIPKCKFRPA